MIDIHDQARNKWPGILQALGVNASYLTGKHGPCPICEAGKDRFRFDDRGGNGTWICSICGSGKGVDLLIKTQGWSFAQAASRIRSILGEVRETAPPKPKVSAEQAMEWNTRLWTQSIPLSDDEAASYLRSRKIPGPYSNDLRFCRSARVNGHPTKTALPAMVALIRDPAGNFVGLHRTYLEGGRKARMDSPRQNMPGPIPDGSAVRLGGVSPVLGIAEGLETAHRVKLRFGVNCWAALNSTLLDKFIVPAGVERLIIYGDNDAKFGGQLAAFKLANRLVTKDKLSIPIEVSLPPIVGTDWADDFPIDQAA